MGVVALFCVNSSLNLFAVIFSRGLRLVFVPSCVGLFLFCKVFRFLGLLLEGLW